ncbi:hypothetical protein [Nocardioides sp. CFH 31398]|uniref:hypothetical protein n=1 Tax=Nocardioides sp. CFH 31398 TaxID=2919579 RepID=UPI001F06A3B0|nr:hypothetical protein [Nocardioides sp. CFH 31398]MCH1868772.1 hypothetical protein [Nocardioides sp. CFH 31398]
MLIAAFRVTVTVLLLVALGACGEDRPERASTVESSDGVENEQGRADDGEQAEAPADPAGEQLTEEQIQAALLTIEDLPSGWTKEASEEDDESEDTIDPARCQEVLDALDEGTGDPAVDGEADFSKGGPFGTFLNVTLSTYDEEVDEDAVQNISDAFTECPEFTTTDAAGEVSDVTVSPVSFANLGDQTLAVRMEFASSEFTIQVNVAYVVIGHNVLAFLLGGVAGSDAAELEDLAGQAVDKLESTTS